MSTTISVEPLPQPGAAARLAFHARLQSPDGLNLLSMSLLRELAELPARYPEASRFLLSGSLRYFSVGADLAEIARLDAPAAFDLGRQGQHWFSLIAASPAPFVALISGYCLGGGLDLALACRARFCAPEAILGHRGAKLGLVTGWGGTQRLPRLIGVPRTLEYLLTASTWSGADAFAQGFAQGLSPAGELLDHALRLPLAELAPLPDSTSA